MKNIKLQGLNEATMKKTKTRVDQLVKPQGSLGALEDLAVKLSGIYGVERPTITGKAVIVMCADHGVCDEGIASAPKIVTLIQSINIAKGVSGVGALAKLNGAKVYTVDIGIDTEDSHELLINQKVKRGTDNIAIGDAMTRSEVERAIEVGIMAAKQAISEGHNLLAIGEMGIGNTTPSTALLSLLSGQSPESLVGIGANFPTEKLPHKAAVIKRAIEGKSIDPNDPLDMLAKVGGLEIAGMTGIILGAAHNRVPVIIDGYISSISAILACRLFKGASDYIIPSHASEEKSAALASSLLGVKPYLHLNMRLGEGSGAVLAFNLVESALAMLNDMITFEEAGIAVV